MELSPSTHRPQAAVVASLGLDRMLSFGSSVFTLCQTLFAKAVGPSGRARVMAGQPPRLDPPAKPPREEAWRSYAVYSGALSLRHHKSSGRYP
ncbi:MAG TPA: hypothetical protein VFE10_15895 [Phenylobacterium sp.]|jgi:hypothetical protein|nr:hypothetical protein [Phenylobacterium sp.]